MKESGSPTAFGSRGWSYLGGRTWAQVTRDERFFCQHLYNRILQGGVAAFVERLNALAGLTLPTHVGWEPGFEVCLYRDLWHLGRKQGELHSPKRTFDLCLFSEQHIVIIEAKAQQGFDQDPEQLAAFRQDRDKVKQLCGVSEVKVVALASSAYLGEPRAAKAQSSFDGRPLAWLDLAEFYDNDPVLKRADEIYEQPDRGGKNCDERKTGIQLRELAEQGGHLYVGRSGGLGGSLLRADIATGQWRTQAYETSQTQPAPSNKNWFSLAEFVQALDA